jgi:hypothetical protein
VVAAKEDVTRLMTLESGKPLAEARAEFDNGCADPRLPWSHGVLRVSRATHCLCTSVPRLVGWVENSGAY